MSYERCFTEDKDLEQGHIETKSECKNQCECDSESEFRTPIYTPSLSTSTSPAPDKQQRPQRPDEPQPEAERQSQSQSQSQSGPELQAQIQTQGAVYHIHYSPHKFLECSFWDLARFVLAFVLLMIMGVVWVEAVKNED